MRAKARHTTSYLSITQWSFTFGFSFSCVSAHAIKGGNNLASNLELKTLLILPPASYPSVGKRNVFQTNSDDFTKIHCSLGQYKN